MTISTRGRVAAHIVSYNTRDATLRCVRDLLESGGVDLEVIVVDNASSDGTAAALEREFPHVRVLASGYNLGYGRAMNLACEQSDAPYVLILNSDCFVSPDTVAGCLDVLIADPALSAVACQLRNEDGSVQRSCRRFPSLGAELARAIVPAQVLARLPGLGAHYLAGWNHDDSRAVDQPAGAYLLMHRGAWGEGPPFDDRFFMYYEDVDLCRRLWHTGPIWFTTSVSARHIGELSSAQARTAMAEALVLSRFQYYMKWHDARAARIASAIGAVASAARALGWLPATALGAATAWSRVRAHLAAARRSGRIAVLGRGAP
jgi:GT2 family glycosyltransferase